MRAESKHADIRRALTILRADLEAAIAQFNKVQGELRDCESCVDGEISQAVYRAIDMLERVMERPAVDRARDGRAAGRAARRRDKPN